MKHLMKLASLFICFSFSINSLAAEDAKTLDALLKKVKSENATQTKEFQKREKAFIAAKNKQAALLKKAKAQLAALEKVTTNLTKSYETNEKKLADLEGKLNIAMGTLGEMFGVVRQTAGDLKGQFDNSVVSAELGSRSQFVLDLSERKSLPTVKELENLWFELQREMTETGKVSTFEAEVVMPDGSKPKKKVTRVGAFNLVADGNYLHYEPETGQVIQLLRQPQSRFLSLIDDLEAAKEGIIPFAIDPSRGALLSMLVQAPSLSERVQQGGIVGYVILSLLVLGLAIVGERIFTLQKEGRKISSQLKSSENIDPDNPLGKLMTAFEKNKGQDLETLELKMDEAIMKATPKLERGVNTVKILAAVAPLLGLLGTVTGMIATFQSITLFGTGDPKLMAGGISTALVTTVLGLVCAIPLLLLHNVISSKSKALIQILEEQTAGLLAQRAQDAKGSAGGKA